MPPLLQWKSNNYYIFWVCIFSLGTQHVMRMRGIILSSVTCPLYHIFPHYLLNDTIFDKKEILNTKCVYWFPLQILSETFLFLRTTERDTIKHAYQSSCKVPTRHTWEIFVKRKLSWQISEKCTNIKFHENPPSGSRAVQCGRTDRQT